MHDLRLVGVHEDGEHLLLSDAEGGRFLLAVDDALRAAVRRDRPHLGQLQIEIEGGLRPRDVQARIRAGATAEEIAGLAGWPVEKVRRYEGPVLAERAHIAGLAREVRLRRRSSSVTLGAEVARRLMARGVDLDQVRWDSWRVEGDPWTVVVTFPAGGRERTARWHLDLTARSVTPGDDEARWLSEDQPEGEGPLAGARLTAVPLASASSSPGAASVYDVEVDGGIGASESSSRGVAAGPSASHEALDLVGAMRARRQAGRGRRRSTQHDVAEGHRGSSEGTGTHPAGRRRLRDPGVEPLDLDPTLMDDPPAAHPPMGLTTDVPDVTGDHTPADVTHADVTHADVTALPTASVSPLGLPVLEPAQEPRSATSEDAASTTSPGTTSSGATSSSLQASPAPGHWPLADAMRRNPAPALLPGTNDPADDPADDPDAGTPASSSASSSSPASSASAGSTRSAAQPASSPTRSGSRRTKRSSVPSWDDIMFGAKQD
jgi:hypothetical protein